MRALGLGVCGEGLMVGKYGERSPGVRHVNMIVIC